jgi:glycosyltransferase involved in cell wall biosynthesis
VAYWNLTHRRVRHSAKGWKANEQPLAFFHFSGITPSEANVFSKHQTRFTAKNIGEVKQLLAEYRACLAANGQDACSELPYAYDTIDGKRAIPRLVRRIYREEIEPKNGSVGDPFARALTYCDAPAPEVVQEPHLLITRLMLKIWQERADLRQAFDLGTRDGRLGLVQWYMHTATRELGMDQVFVSAVIERYHSGSATAETEIAAAQHPHDGPANETIRRRLARHALAQAPRIRSLYRKLPEPIRQKSRNWLLRQAHGSRSRSGQLLADDPPSKAMETAPAAEPSLAPGALLIGYPRAELGMGEHVRLSALAISTTQMDFGIYEFGHNVEARQNDERLVSHITDDARFRANVFHINADQMDVAYRALGRDVFGGRYNIGYWAWELQEFPDVWLPAMEHLEEIWAPSRFIQVAISEKARCPVVWMPLAVNVTPPKGIGRKHFGIPDHAFVFLFYFDFASYSSRKNPEAVATAFQGAFKDRDDNVALLIKSIGLERHSSETDELRKLLGQDPRIVFIDHVLSHEEMAALVNCCDSFVSLHRSEGFGRGLAEAMFLGKPVIATNYSGNTDFTRENTACLVNYSLVPIKPGEYPEGEGQYWADPDIDHAIWHMRRLVEQPDLAHRIGAAGKAIIRANHSLSRVGARYQARLERLGLS